MTIFPQAKSDGLVAIEVAETLVIQDAAGWEIARLDKDAARVWQLADGTISADAICRTLNAGRETPISSEFVWSLLDRLADMDLLEQRVTPPAGDHLRSRRGILKDVVAGSGIIAITAAPAAAIAAGASEEQQAKHSALVQESTVKKNTMSTETTYKRNQGGTTPQVPLTQEQMTEENEKRNQGGTKPQVQPTQEQVAEQHHKQGQGQPATEQQKKTYSNQAEEQRAKQPQSH